MSSGAATASVSAYNALPPQAGGAPGPYATSLSPNLAAGSGASSGANGQQNGTANALNPDSVSSNPQNQYRSLMHQEMIAPVPPAGVSAADSAQIFKIGNSGLVAITIAGVVIGVTSFVGVQAIYEAFGQRHKHDARRAQQRQDDRNVELADGRQKLDKAEAGFVQTATAHQDAVIASLNNGLTSDKFKSDDLKTAFTALANSTGSAGVVNAHDKRTHLRGVVAKQLADLDRPFAARANATRQHAKLLLGDDGQPITHAQYEQNRADLPTDYTIEHDAFVVKAVDPIAHKWAVIK